MKSKLLAVAVIAATTGVVALYPTVHSSVIHVPQPPVVDPVVGPSQTKKRPTIEVVFALDTTGSMGGLIAGAKENIWSIASTMASAEGNPEIRMGLVAYRDRGDAYVTQVADLSTDLDSMYSTLMDFQAAGGGDGPESVNQALHDAVNQMSWSQDPNAYKVIFLVGDAPGHTDYPNDVPFADSVRLAANKGIVVNTIQCGGAPMTKIQWEQIAQLGLGKYMNVEQGGGALAVTTPFDDQIAELSAQLDGSRVFFGDELAMAEAEKKQAAADKVNLLGSAGSRAKRALFNISSAGAANFAGKLDLVEAVESGRVDLDEVPEAELPAEMQAMAPAARDSYIKTKAMERSELRQRIVELSDQRKDYVTQELAKDANVKESLDHQIFATVAEQAASKGLTYDSKPDY